MKRFLSLSLCLLLVCTAGVALAATATGTADRDVSELRYTIGGRGEVITSNSSSLYGFAKAQAETLCLYGGPDALEEGRFQSGPGGVTPDRQGWEGIDLTDNPVFWQRSTYNAGNLSDPDAGDMNHAYWCGQSVSQQPGWSNPPGYGNGWFDLLLFETPVVSSPSVGQTVGLEFFFNHDTEPGYDFFEVQYDSGGVWTTVLSLDGSNKDGSGVFNPPGVQYSGTSASPIVYVGGDYSALDTAGQIRLRMVVSSDGAWSDEDGLWPTDGAAQVDNITVNWSDGSVQEGFEGLPPYAWAPDKAPFAGDFSKTFPRVTDIDPCRENETPQMTFIDDNTPPPNGPGINGAVSTGGTTSINWAYGVTGGWVVNYNGGLTFGELGVSNEVWSPPIQWTTGDPLIDNEPEYAGGFIRFDVYRHQPLINGLFYVWHVRSTTDPGDPATASWTSWEDRNFVYYSNTGNWLPTQQDVTDLLLVSPTYVQMALGMTDLASVFAFPGNDATPAPTFDNAAFCRYRLGGPVFATRDIDLANDGFPTSGSIDASTVAARDALDIPFDRANDASTGDLNIPGDSIMVDITSNIPGADLADYRMVWILDPNPLFDAVRTPPARAKDVNFDPNYLGTGQWYGESLGDTSTTSAGAVVENRYFFDLPDVDFMYPGDELRYYIQASDTDGRTTTLPANTTGFVDGAGYNQVFTIRGLPSITSADGAQPGKLVWNDFLNRGLENDLVSAFDQLGFEIGVDYDYYKTNGPTSGVSNGLGSAGAHGANGDQLAGYNTILYFVEDLRVFTLSDGSNTGQNDKGDDLGTLTQWHGLAGDRYFVAFGDYIATGPSLTSAAGATFVQTLLSIQPNDPDVSDEINNQTSPVVRPLAAGFSTEYVGFGGCLGINEFDSMQPLAPAVRGHGWVTPSNAVYPTLAASVIHDRLDAQNDRKVDISFAHGFGYIFNKNNPDPVPPAGPSARTELLREIFDYLGVPSGNPGNATDVPVQTATFSLNAAPNPFNPSTKISFAIPVKSEASVKIYNLRGELVRTVHAGELTADTHGWIWSGVDNNGASVASGVYLIEGQAEGFRQVLKVALIK